MRPTHPLCFGLLAVSAAALLPSALHAQAISRSSRSAGQAPPAPSALYPAPPAPIYNMPFAFQAAPAPSSFGPQGGQAAPQQFVPLRGAPIYAQPAPGGYPILNGPVRRGYPLYAEPQSPVSRAYAPQFPSRAPGYSASAPFSQGGASARRAGGDNAGIVYRNYGTGPVFEGQAAQTRHHTVRVTTPYGTGTLPGNGIYSIYGTIIPNSSNGGYRPGVPAVGQPTFLGGYYYGGYCDAPYGAYTYPSVYSTYSGFPDFIYSPASVIVLSDPYAPAYVTGYQPFYTPSYPVVYNQNIYYVGSQERAQQITGDDDTARKAALRNAYPEGSFQAAFGDIERAWLDGNVSALQKHLRGDDVKLSVFFKGKYSYSIATSDYVQITRDAFDKLQTVSFKFDRLRKAKNGDVTAYGTHVYRGSANSDSAGTDATVPFSTDSDPGAPDSAPPAATGAEKTANVAYTLRHQDNQWNIVAIDSSPAGAAK